MRTDIKKLLGKLGLIVPLFIIVAAVNITVDPARLFKSKLYEERMAKALWAGKNVTAFTNANFDDRYLQKYLVELFPKKFDIVVFGSSRAMQISSTMFPGKSLFNNSVSAAALPDFVALYGLYREKGLIPSTLILTVDPWIFQYNNGFNKWQSLKFQYEKTAREMSGSHFKLKLRLDDLISTKYLEIFSLSYFQSCVVYLKAHHWKLGDSDNEKHWFKITQERFNDDYTILPDGSWTWSKTDRTTTPQKARQKTQTVVDGDVNRNLFGYFDLDPDLKKQFEDFVAMLKRDGVKVIFWLAPYHPIYYDAYTKNNKQKILSKVENYVRSVAQAQGIPCVGSYNPYALSLDDTVFYDYHHMKDDNTIGRLFAALGEL